MMKIAFIGGRDIYKLGGIETYMFNLCTKLVQHGYEPVVYCESNCNKIEYVNGFKVIYWKSPKSIYTCKIWLGLKSTLHALFVEDNVKIFHYNAWPPSLWNWIPRLMGRKAIMMGHGLEWKHTKYSKRQQKVLKFMEKVTAMMNNHMIMCSDYQSKYFKKRYKRDCVTIPCAINIPERNEIDSGILERYKLEKNGYFLYLGRLVQIKKPEYFIGAYIKSQIKDIKLVMAGSNDTDPDYVKMLKDIAKDYDNVIFTGAVYNNDKNALLCNCAAFCIPSTSEGLAITLLEAMSFSRPVIASDIDGNREALGDNALWVKAEDEESLCEQLAFFKHNMKDLEVKGVENKVRVESMFTWDKTCQRYIDYIENI